MRKIVGLVLVVALVVAMLSGLVYAATERTEKFAEEMFTEEGLRETVPTYKDAEAKVICLDCEREVLAHRFLLWTRDLRHVMWGSFGRGHFVGEDNEGNQVWGVYHRGAFAGFYDADFFIGKYRNGHWKAQELFGEKTSHGRFVVFPGRRPTLDDAGDAGTGAA